MLGEEEGVMVNSFSLEVSRQGLAKHLANLSDIVGAMPRLTGLVSIFWLLQVLVVNGTYLYPYSEDFPNLMGVILPGHGREVMPFPSSFVSHCANLAANDFLRWGVNSLVILPLGGKNSLV